MKAGPIEGKSIFCKINFSNVEFEENCPKCNHVNYNRDNMRDIGPEGKVSIVFNCNNCGKIYNKIATFFSDIGIECED